MGIDFRMAIDVKVRYFNYETCELEHESNILHAEMELGNYRALRSILTEEELDDYCGEKVVTDLKAVDAWLYRNTALQPQCALAYIKQVAKFMATANDTEYCKHVTEVTINWG